jgi:hypothetical protein
VGTGITFSAAVPSGATGVEFTGAVTGTGSPKTSATSTGTKSAQVRAYTTDGTTCYSAYSSAKSGTVTANNTIALASGSTYQGVLTVPATAIDNITYNTTGATGVSAASMPAGVTAAYASNKVTISGTPSTNGTSTYTITLTGGCGTIKETGTIYRVAALPAKSATTYSKNGQIWSDVINLSACNKTSYDPYTVNGCRNNGSYGYLYSGWYVRAYEPVLCPKPWRVPVEADFCKLINNSTTNCDASEKSLPEIMPNWSEFGNCDGEGTIGGTGTQYLWGNGVCLVAHGGTSVAVYNSARGMPVRCIR